MTLDPKWWKLPNLRHFLHVQHVCYINSKVKVWRAAESQAESYLGEDEGQTGAKRDPSGSRSYLSSLVLLSPV